MSSFNSGHDKIIKQDEGDVSDKLYTSDTFENLKSSGWNTLTPYFFFRFIIFVGSGTQEIITPSNLFEESVKSVENR